VRGVIEGFYGNPWSWQERHEIGTALAAAGMDTYVYAPKDDPLHRERWREPYPDDELARFATFADTTSLRLGFTVSPGLSIDVDDAADRAALLTKFTRMIDVGVELVGVLFDDLEPSPDAGRRHGELTAWLRSRLPAAVELFTVPLHYTGCERSSYLDQLCAELPDEVALGWTGRHVVNATITVDDARARREATGGRAPLLWDNTPVNDALMVDHLFTGPLRGRDPELPAELAGYLANPLVQPRASLPALCSAAAWLRGADPHQAWEDALGDDRIVLEGCDGAVPAALAEAALADGDWEPLDDWLALAERCELGGLDESARPWVEQLRAEAAVARVASGVLRADPDEARRVAPLLYVMWPAVRSSPLQVLGGRGSLLPRLGQDERSRWIADASSWVAPASVTDRLVAAAFEHLR
jgi:beta-N-acetylglucosaminidase